MAKKKKKNFKFKRNEHIIDFRMYLIDKLHPPNGTPAPVGFEKKSMKRYW